jgi:Concanavalin A-like lectin/glucanases superfamily
VDAVAEELDLDSMTAFAFELWFQTDTVTPAGGDFLATGPNTAGGFQWELQIDATGHIVGKARNSVPTTFTVTSGPIAANTWYHVVLTITGGNLTLFVNGASVASTAWSGAFANANAGAQLALGGFTGVSTFVYDEVGFNRGPLSATRVAAHYTAGTARGFGRNTSSNIRIRDVLDAVKNHAPRSLRVGTAGFLRGRFMHGQSPLEEMKLARDCDNVDAMLFIAKDGTVVFLDRAHRSVSPWNTTQLIFGDEGLEHVPAEYPYTELDTDYSDSFIINEVNTTREGGIVSYTSRDQTSIDRYGLTSLSISTISNADDATIAPALLAKYKDPMLRAMSLTVTTDDVNVTDEIFKREIGDRVRVIRTIPKALGWFDQTLYIQKIEIDNPGEQRPWTIRLVVSPL